MIIIHIVNALLPRLLSTVLQKAARVMPVVVTGARQTGKSTLVRDLEKPSGARRSFPKVRNSVRGEDYDAPRWLVQRNARRRMTIS
jgi:predicted AAA+ superfamily ATPase